MRLPSQETPHVTTKGAFPSLILALRAHWAQRTRLLAHCTGCGCCRLKCLNGRQGGPEDPTTGGFQQLEIKIGDDPHTYGLVLA